MAGVTKTIALRTLPTGNARKFDATSPVSAAKAKTHLLALLNQVDRDRTSIIITKRGKPVARLEPVEKVLRTVEFGFMKGRMKIHGDIVSADPELWDSEQ